MHHLAAFYAAVTDSTNNQAVAGVLDGALPYDSSSRFLYSEPQQVLAAFAMGDAILAARINAPSLRNFLLPSISPIEVAAVPASSPGMAWYGQNGPRLLATEGVCVEVSVGVQTIDTAYAAIWSTPKFVPAPLGPIFTARATSTITTVVGSWVLGSFAFEQTLPSGRYAVVGMHATGATSALCRIIFPGGTTLRPGVIVMPNADAVILSQPFRYGAMGLWGTFINTAQPQVELLGTSAASIALTLFLDLVKIG